MGQPSRPRLAEVPPFYVADTQDVTYAEAQAAVSQLINDVQLLVYQAPWVVTLLAALAQRYRPDAQVRVLAGTADSLPMPPFPMLFAVPRETRSPEEIGRRWDLHRSIATATAEMTAAELAHVVTAIEAVTDARAPQPEIDLRENA